MNKKIALILIPIAFLAVSCNRNPQFEITSESSTVTVAGLVVNVQVADTDLARQQGLSGRDSMGANDGMIFIFPSQGKYTFWMKDMKFPLDFIWILDGKVTQITSGVPIQPNLPDEDLTTYLPAGLVDSVLEVNAGWAAKNMIKAGDLVVDRF